MEIKPKEEFFTNGQIAARHYINAAGKYHRDPTEGPAISCWFENGQRNYQYYYVDGKIHRDPLKGPATERWDEDGTKTSEYYFKDGLLVAKPEEIKVETDKKEETCSTEETPSNIGKITLFCFITAALVSIRKANKTKTNSHTDKKVEKVEEIAELKTKF